MQARPLSRIAAREIAMRLIFALFENPSDPKEFVDETLNSDYWTSLAEFDDLYEKYDASQEADYIRRLVIGAYEHGPELDDYIMKYSPNWNFDRISRTAAAVIRTAMYETTYMRDVVPPKAAINAAIDIARKYDEDEVAAFVNGVLGAFYRAELSGFDS